MVKLLVYSNTPLTTEPIPEKLAEISSLYIKYKSLGKIVGEYLLLQDNAVQIPFKDIQSAESFKQEATALYTKYNDTISFQYTEN